MAEKVTIMKLKVDLECEKCYKKVKKVLCKFPQIRDQLYDEKKNTVTIKVVCCSPEKLRDKLCYKGGGSIKAIEIVEPPKPKPEPKKEEPKKEAEKPKSPPHRPPAPPSEPPRVDAPGPPPVEMAAKFLEPMPVTVLAYPPPAVPFGLFYESDSDGYGRPIYDSYGGGGHCYMSRHDPHSCQEDVSGCTIA